MVNQQDGAPVPPEKPKLTAAERRARQEERLAVIRLKVLIGQELEARGMTNPTALGVIFGLPPAEAEKVMRRHQWREGDLARLKAAAAALGLAIGEAKGPGSEPRP
jgi:hypothetical protein